MQRITVALIVLFAPALVLAQWGSSGAREDSWELSVGAIYQGSESVGGEAGDPMAAEPNTSSLSLSDEWGYSFNVTYNFTNKLALGADFDFIRPRYDLTLVPDDPNDQIVQVNHKASQFNGRLKGTYTFTEGSFAPFVDAGIGWSNFDSNIISGPPITGCWWHPWWGYICENFYNTFSSTEFSYGAGIGFRYEFQFGGFIKASYNNWWLDSGGQSDDFSMSSGRIEYGWRF